MDEKEKYRQAKTALRNKIVREFSQSIQKETDDDMKISLMYDLALSLENRDDMINLTSFIKQMKEELFLGTLIES